MQMIDAPVLEQSATPRRYTVSEFDAFLAQHENADRAFELIHGEIVEKAMPTREHGIIAGMIVTFLNMYLRQNPIGYAAVEARHHAPQNDENDRLPDVSFVAGRDRAIEQIGSAPYMPDLCVEIQSPRDSMKWLRDKAHYYLAHGSRMVWLVYPQRRVVEIYTLDDVDILTVKDTLEGGDVLPGFSVPVSEIFPA